MVELQAPRLNAVFHALGDATRRRMLHELSAGERTVSQLAAPFAMSLAAASKHIRTLEGAGLIRREVQGRVHLCRLDAGPLSEANRWLQNYERFWNSRLDELERLLRAEAAGPIGKTTRATKTAKATKRTKTGKTTGVGKTTRPDSSGAKGPTPTTPTRRKEVRR